MAAIDNKAMKKHAVVVGINRYDDLANINSLQFAEQDAWRVAYSLRSAGFTVSELIGSAARAQAISNAVTQLCSGLGNGDLFVCYFAGHAYEDSHGQMLLLPADVRLEELKQEARGDTVPLRFFEITTAPCGASRVLLLDVCRASLEIVGGLVELAPSVAQDARVVCQTVPPEKPPLAVVFSCSEHQRAYEITDQEVRGGAFSSALVQALNDHLKAGRELILPADLQEVAANCHQLLERLMFGCRQDPWCVANRDRIVLLEAAQIFMPEELAGHEQQWQEQARLRKRDEAVAEALRRAAAKQQETGVHATSWKQQLPLRRATRQKLEQEEQMRAVAEAKKAAEEERRRQETQRQERAKKGKRLRWALGIALALGVALAAWYAIPSK